MKLSAHHVNRTWKPLSGLVLLAVLLYLAAVTGMAYVAGFHAVWHRIEHARWSWLAPAFGGVLIAFAGYFVAYRGIAGGEDGPKLKGPSLLAVVSAGFGGFLAQGGTTIDDFAMRAGGASKREANVRVSSLAGFEHGVLAMIACPVAIAALIVGVTHPRPDFTWPWAVIAPLGFAALPKLRALGERGENATGRGTRTTEGGEPALQH